MAWYGTCIQKVHVHTKLSTAALQLVVKLIEAHFRWNIKVSLCIWSLDIVQIVHIICTCRLLQLWGRSSWTNLQWYQLCRHLSWLLKVNLWYMFIIVAQYYDFFFIALQLLGWTFGEWCSCMVGKRAVSLWRALIKMGTNPESSLQNGTVWRWCFFSYKISLQRQLLHNSTLRCGYTCLHTLHRMWDLCVRVLHHASSK